jgi:hypothetical protein
LRALPYSFSFTPTLLNKYRKKGISTVAATPYLCS